MTFPSTQAILIVDDDPSVADTFSRLLQLEGFTVYTAINPEGGLEIAADKHPDAIILDLRMPILSGLQFLQLLRKTPALRHTPVAIVTGDYFLDDGITSQTEALGASVRFKPIWLDDLVALARGLIAA
ncbi:MAG: response regulator [Vicinamibacterales bacterium]|jgi:two-component system response regulator PrrA|nr:response regulator [Vicinamibacterales bacterium]